MFKKFIFLLALTFIILFGSGLSIAVANDSSKNAGKINIPPTTTCADQQLQLNGYGIRKKFFVKLYVASLYVQDKLTDADLFLELAQASCMRLHITSSKITSEKMIKATQEGFQNATQGNTAPIETEIETFLAYFEQPIKKGDVFEFAFVPHNATHVIKNGVKLGVIENKEFASALYGIWLGEMPAQPNLKSQLLGN